MIESALKSDGAAGPSGLNAEAWKRLCSLFSQSSVDLWNAIASVTRRLCSTYVDPKGLSALVACRLIALDKCPGIRPIGIGETMRRIMSRVVLSILKPSMRDVVELVQVSCVLVRTQVVKWQYMP